MTAVLALLALPGLNSEVSAQEPYLVKDINPGSGDGPDIGNFADLNGILIFEARNGEDGYELWRSDGSAQGTYQLKDIRLGPDGSSPAFTQSPEDAILDDELFFSAFDEGGLRDLWKTDGTPEGTVFVADFHDTGSSPSWFFRLGNEIFFDAVDSDGDGGLWKTDGTSEGTVLVEKIRTGEDSNIAFTTRVGSLVFFRARDSFGDRELWVTDGTSGGTFRVRDINTTGDSSPNDFQVLGSQLIFSATDSSGDNELWRSDGTELGTVRIIDINESGSSSPTDLGVFDGEVYFAASTPDEGTELYKTDGTEEGTTRVRDINPAFGVGSNPQHFAAFDDFFLFVANDGDADEELWRSDGTEEGTVRVKDINPGGSAFIGELTFFQGKAWFRADDGTHGAELWRSDGTAEGTRLVRDLNPSGDGDIGEIDEPNAGGRLFFLADEDNGLGRELYAIGINPPHLANIATRARVGTGDNVMIAGFIISGGRKRVIVRVQGPSLIPFGVPGVLSDPTLAIFSGPTQIAFNDDWQDTQETEINDSGFAPGDSDESAIILELDEGPYTAIVSGGIGNAIVEVFELD